jgi:adenylate cyclase
MAEEMQGLAREMLPLASPMMDAMHQRSSRTSSSRTSSATWRSTSRARSTLAGGCALRSRSPTSRATRGLTEELGDEIAVDAVERFTEAVENTLPDDAAVVKTIGDEVMVVGSDVGRSPTGRSASSSSSRRAPAAAHRHAPRRGHLPRRRLLRREVNLSARVAARSAGGEVVVTRPLVDLSGAHLEFERIGEVRLKGFTDPTELYLARQAEEDD